MYILSPEEKYDIKTIGVKAKNLIPHLVYVPDFVILSTLFYENWSKDKASFLIQNNDVISSIGLHFQQKNLDNIIIRSSCTSETIDDRGRYLSKNCSPTVPEIRETIQKIYLDFENRKSGEDKSMALIIQVYINPKKLAHLSNERRVNKSNLVWLLEETSTKEISGNSTYFTVENPSKVYDHSLSICLNSPSWLRNVQSFASYFSSLKNRFHFEILWDGGSFWLLQVDVEIDFIKKGTKPGSAWTYRNKKENNDYGNLEVFENVSTASGNWHKIECVKTFNDCNLPYWPIFVLENRQTLGELAEGTVSIPLTTDLKKLLISPIVIRTDTTSSDFMLPRTETIYTLDEAKSFLISKAKYFIEQGCANNEFAFLIHHFIASSACALSLTSSNIDITRIDSTWGIIEGLYYNAHDSFEFNHRSNRITKKLRCKSKYIDVSKEGTWSEKEAGINFDWRQSLSDAQIITIANYTQTISKFLKSTVSVMFFVNNKKYYPEIIPWYYTTEEVTDTGTIHDNGVLATRRACFIKSKEDFEKLKNEYSDDHKISLFLDLNFELCRNTDLIENIANFARDNNITVDLKGSVLSHPYYVFKANGVKVRCIDPFTSNYAPKKFYKLVRDKIPAIIENNNEKAYIRKVAASELLVLLKDKIVEEANELHWSKSDDENIEEMSDVYEVLRGLCKLYGIDINDIEHKANEKREKRGGFENGIVLVATKEQSAIKLSEGSGTSLFDEEVPELKKLNIKIDPEVRFFQKGMIDNFRSLTQVSRVSIPYINEVSSKSDSFRYKLKENDYNAISIIYEPKNIVVVLEKLTEDQQNPSQLHLFDKKK